jgi:hypothetical protein
LTSEFLEALPLEEQAARVRRMGNNRILIETSILML